MPNKAPSQPVEAAPKKPRSPVERAIVWTLIAALVAVTGWEAWQRHGYNKTLAALQTTLKETEKTPSGDFTLTAARSLFRGWPTETEHGNAFDKKLEVKWPSLFKDFRVQLQIGPDEVVLALRSAEDLADAIPNQVASAAKPDVKTPRAHSVDISNIYPGGVTKSDPIVFVDVNEPREVPTDAEQGILIRELGRQAILIAARDELSLATRDRVLGESLPYIATPVLKPISAVTTIDGDGRALVSIYGYNQSSATGNVEVLATFTLPLSSGDHISQLAAALEPLSRNEFVKVLGTAGYTGKPRKFAAEGPVPAELEQQASKLDSISQFLLLRTLHAETQKNGESIPRLAAIAQTYARLGTLTEAHWSPMHKTFKARALIYAERLINKAPKQATALWNRAYVRALVGLPDSALSDLEAAKRLKTASEREPAWLAAIEAYSRSDTQKLEACAKDAATSALATYLQMLAADLSTSVPVRFEAADKMLKTHPDCLRAWDVMGRDSRLGVMGRVSNVLYVQLKALGRVPEELQKLMPDLDVKNIEGLKGKATALYELLRVDQIGKDKQEPNLGILRQLVKESSFVLAWKTVSFSAGALGVDANELIDQVRPMVIDHHFVKFIEGHHSSDTGLGYSNLQDLARVVEPWRLEFTEEPFFAYLDAYRLDSQSQSLRLKAWQHSDPVLRDLVSVSRAKVAEQSKQKAAQKMRAIASLSPVTATISIQHDWQDSQELLPKWDKAFQSDVDYLQAMAEMHRIQGRPEEAAKTFERQLAVAYNFDTVSTLSGIYQDLDDDAKWRAILEFALKQESKGLEDAQVHAAIAQHHMRRKEWDLALPHANAAASSYASSFLICAADCYQGMGDWENAELFQRRNSERYETDAMHWYRWCRATNHGDVDAARKLIVKKIEQYRDSQNAEAQEIVAQYEVLESNLPQALYCFGRAFDIQHSPYDGLHAALIADELGKTQERDEYLKRCSSDEIHTETETVELIRLFRQHLASDSKEPLPPKAVEWILQKADSGATVTNLLYFAGKFMERRGMKDAAQGYFERAAGSGAVHKLNHAFASRELHKMGVALPTPLSRVFEAKMADAFNLVVRANNELDENHRQSALWYCDKALRVEPNSTKAIHFMANLLHAQGHMKEALEYYNRLMPLVQNDPDLHQRRGFLLETQGEHAAAIAEYETAMQIAPAGDGSATNNLAMLYASSIDSRFRDPAKAMELAHHLQTCSVPDLASRVAVLATAHAAQGQFDEALQKIDLAIQSAPLERRIRLMERRELFKQRKPYVRAENWWQ